MPKHHTSFSNRTSIALNSPVEDIGKRAGYDRSSTPAAEAAIVAAVQRRFRASSGCGGGHAAQDGADGTFNRNAGSQQRLALSFDDGIIRKEVVAVPPGEVGVMATPMRACTAAGASAPPPLPRGAASPTGTTTALLNRCETELPFYSTPPICTHAAAAAAAAAADGAGTSSLNLAPEPAAAAAAAAAELPTPFPPLGFLSLSDGLELHTADMASFMTTAVACLQANWSALSAASGSSSSSSGGGGSCIDCERTAGDGDSAAAAHLLPAVPPPPLPPSHRNTQSGGGTANSAASSNASAVGRYGALTVSSAGWRCTELYDLHDTLLLSRLPRLRGMGGVGGGAVGADNTVLVGYGGLLRMAPKMAKRGPASVLVKPECWDSDLQAVEEAAAEISLLGGDDVVEGTTPAGPGATTAGFPVL
ncbi:hypothetical protein VOLCADRAFT_89819 [Volvox carteri f. nagariensis]|uniref:Uncharacterized protein n=1 Tax=Volvox carteri f. nagariensis TaxID=3068 RepID=D8TSQ9_VOLCA|nr:uncharacterized protein VOLCADRAFT_89819 [Volvox carteri f. nagariensis]EFJ49414.1 hypothetical protein VOLCADRAFT_89819 [Volvox carteri f. nagariensis]|eukprot:XP_002949395.1 hypothetical protein VOLCADRAFT_89819 [Volvox carteri f. nagariensis]